MAVFSALNDAEVLRRSIPGCEAIEARSPTEMTATVALKIGPIKMRLSGEVTLANIDPPHCYTIIGQGNGGAVGFASGTAEVHLAPDGDATVLTRRDRVSRTAQGAPVRRTPTLRAPRHPGSREHAAEVADPIKFGRMTIVPDGSSAPPVL